MQAMITVQDYYLPSPLIQISAPWLNEKNITLIVKREDLIHPWLSGNKYRKLKYNLLNTQTYASSMFHTGWKLQNKKISQHHYYGPAVRLLV